MKVEIHEEPLWLVYGEMLRQDLKWGLQKHEDGTDPSFSAVADEMRKQCREAFDKGVGTWRHILEEEVYEACAETDPDKLTNELLQVAAVALQWVEDIKRRQTS